MLKHRPKDALKKNKLKTMLFSNEPVYYTEVSTDRRNHNGYGLNTATLTAAQIVTLKKLCHRPKY